jgi:nucleotide-binding universal stress UspA family protein
MVAFTKVLVPLDGSELAEHALSAIDLLVRAGCRRVALVRVPDADNKTSEAEQYLSQVAERLSGRNLEIETSTPHGEPAEAIVAEVARLEADVLAMATHGRSGLGRVLFGSVAASVLQRAPVPVLVTRAWERPPATRSADDVERVLVPLDGSDLAEAVLPVVGALASSSLAAELTLLRVIEPPHDMMTGWVPGAVFSDIGTEAEQAEALTYLRGLADQLQRQHGVADSKIDVDVRVGQSTDTILEAIREHRCTLVCMVTHAQRGLGRVIVGSVTDGVLKGGATPLLLVRPS